MTASKHLINGRPLIVLPELATAVGLNEAIILQQIHYWLLNYETAKKESHFYDGRWWVYNTYVKWQKDNFPFWSERTIQRIMLSLQGRGLLIGRELGAKAYDHTKWYTIDYEALDSLMNNEVPRQVGTIDDETLSGPRHDKLALSSYTESNQESTTETSGQPPSSDFIFGDSSSTPTTKHTQHTKKPPPNTPNTEKGLTPRAISERITEQQRAWPEHFDSLPPHLKILAPLKRCLPATWTEVHIFLYLKWRNKRADEKAPQTEIRNVEGIYNLFEDKLKATPSETAIVNFMAWYRSQDWVIEIANRESMGVVEQVKLPLAGSLSLHLEKWLASRQAQAPAPPAYFPPEASYPLNKPVKRGTFMGLGGGK